VHRFAWNFNYKPSATRKQLTIQSTLTHVTPLFAEEAKTKTVADGWFNTAMQAFISQGYDPSATVCTLPEGVVLDATTNTVRSSQTTMTMAICNSMLQSAADTNPQIGVFNSGSIRLDDKLQGTIQQYDIIRTLPYGNTIQSANVTGAHLAAILTTGASAGMLYQGNFLSYCGIYPNANFNAWSTADGVNIATSGRNYTIASIDYLFTSGSFFLQPRFTVLQSYNLLPRATVNYLASLYGGQ
jgi:2',3'-cyclic-nucleotide 2'-phosphodiesterase (5'-nucleotidase family)